MQSFWRIEEVSRCFLCPPPAGVQFLRYQRGNEPESQSEAQKYLVSAIPLAYLSVGLGLERPPPSKPSTVHTSAPAPCDFLGGH